MSHSSLLLTWRDVRDRLGVADSHAWGAAEVDLFGLRVFTSERDAACAELSRRLGSAFDRDRMVVDMVGTRDHPRTLPVEILDAGDAPETGVIPQRPLWSSRQLANPWPGALPEVPIAAYFSFKGGVGRTTAAFATLARLLNRAEAPRVLYVDADVEAPGLTWMVDPEERVSWVDTLSLVHDADDWRTDALPLIAERVALSRVGLEMPVGRREFFLLPAVRRLEQIERVPVTPEQLVRRRGREWVIGDLLVALAQELHVDVVLVDLRAGITEFSSPLLLDPRCHDVFVTSCARQSVLGVVRALEQAELRVDWAISLDVLITQVPPNGDAVFQEVSQAILDAWANARPGDIDEAVPVPGRVDFEQQLIVFDDLQAVADRLPGTTLWKAVAGLADRLAPDRPTTPPSIQESAPDGTRIAIARLAERFEFAESNAILGLLPTPPLQSLARLPPGQLPAAVVLGSKGAGKTFAWGQLVIAGTWANFVQQVQPGSDPPADALIFPLLSPQNLGDEVRPKVRAAEQVVTGLGGTETGSSTLRSRLNQLVECQSGLAFWLRAIAERLGLADVAGASVRTLDDALELKQQRVVLVIDGMEDALQTGPHRRMSEGQRIALRGLLVDLINELREVMPRNLGMVAFVRQDLAREAIPQNFGQFEARHREVALTWSNEDALRLVLWLLDQAGWTSLRKPEDVGRAPYEELAEALHPFWNAKMGGSKEAFTDRWVIAALSDLRGRFQARDLVRLVHRATQRSTTLPLAPNAIRKAVEWCSEKKVEELEAEVVALRDVFQSLRDLPEDARMIPIPRQNLGLTDEQVEFLQDQGLLMYDKREDQYYMPEIIRHGLGFRLSRRGRARVVSLQRAAASNRR